MIKCKANYLDRLYSKMNFKSVEYSEKIEGSSPPSVFIGRFNYPKVAVGPLLAATFDDTSLLDLPEQWIPENKTAKDIVDFRMQLIRGKKSINVNKTGGGDKIVGLLQEIALAKNPLDVDAEFKKKPKGRFFHEEVQPFGPSAVLKDLSVANGKFDLQLEKAYNDTDLKANDAVIQLYDKGVIFSSIQKAFSTGAFGLEKKRKLVPTRWSITAVDSALSEHIMKEVKHYEPIEEYRVYEAFSLNNKFLIIMLPTVWKYEWIEAFFPSIIGDKLEIFGDYEHHEKKKEYATVGGCYYSARLAVLEKLNDEKRQAGVLIFREAYEGYVPLGVWNVRENVRLAMNNSYEEFESLNATLTYSVSRLKLKLGTWFQHSSLLRQAYTQKRLADFQKAL
jgi:DNA repair protein NreA